MKNYYKLLDVEPNASQEEIKTAYRICAKKFHPDKHPTNSDYYNALFAEINEAYQTLSNPELRGDYDENYFFFYFKAKDDTIQVNPEVFRQKEEFEIVEIKRSIPFLKHVFEINNQTVRYNKRLLEIDHITDIMYGVAETGLFWGDMDFHIIVRTDENETISIPFASLLTSEAYQYSKYLDIVDLVNYYITPHIVSKLISKLDNGGMVTINKAVQLNRLGIHLTKSNKIITWKNLEIKKGKWVSFAYRTEKITLIDKLNPKIKQKVVPLWYLNAITIPTLHNFYMAKTREVVVHH
ncbi:DnaJ domain-containing protein [Pontibacter sp. HSC-14F20]|uniref:J domain-containing protein n=1 Tax=Pontibacter sp. HSC-14F20 TaxID=2864136 RepID=UPI001C7323BA|nr:DnaJ domain-containing protein [Pontibacter sp. HSC-14F20]MBX0335545.1 DnaJ domain-containing protein [Pontibacter sp. HSC-14F20]